MKTFTSYYGNKQLASNRYFFVQVSNSAPKGFQTDIVFKETIPDWDTLVKPYKEGRLNDTDYIKKYEAQLDKKAFEVLLILDTIIEQAHGKDIVLLCYERPENFCHRHILAKWLEKHAKNFTKDFVLEDIREIGTGQLQLF